MKKALAVLIALLMALSLLACGQNAGTEPGGSAPASSTPSSDSSAGSPGAATQSSPGASAAAAAYPKEVGYFDPNFDYTQYKKFKVKYLIPNANFLFDAFDKSFAIWAPRMNIDYAGMWTPTTENNTDEYLSGLQTFIDQGFNGILIDSDKSICKRIAEMLNEAKVAWIGALGQVRDLEGNKPLYSPTVGFDNFITGYDTAVKLCQWKDQAWPDVPWEKVGMVCVDYSPFPDPHQRILGSEQYWAEQNPSFGTYDESVSANPKNFFICDTATSGGGQTVAQSMVTQVFSDPGDIEVWLVSSTLDDYSIAAANAAESLGITDKVCVAGYGGNALVIQFDSGADTAWRYAFFIPQSILTEPVLGGLWALMSGQATAETLWPDWINKHDKGDIVDASGKVVEEHNYASLRVPGQWIDKDNYKSYLEWTDLYTYGPDSDGDYKYDKVTDLNLFSARDKVPDSYK